MHWNGRKCVMEGVKQISWKCVWAPNSTRRERGGWVLKGVDKAGVRLQARSGHRCGRRVKLSSHYHADTQEAPSVPVSHYKSGVTQSAEDNRPPHLIKRHRLLLRVKAAIDFTLTHSLVRERRAAKAASRLPRIIHSPSHKVSIVYSRLK